MAARHRTFALAAVICSVLVAAPAVASMRSATPDVSTHRAFQPVSSPTTAFTYDESGVPQGATASVEAFYLGDGSTAVTRSVPRRPASNEVSAPGPQPTSRARCPGPGPTRSTNFSPSGSDHRPMNRL